MRRDGGTAPGRSSPGGDDRRSILTFGGFEVDLAAGELRCEGHPIAMQPLIFDLLVHFVRHPHALCTKDALVREVWKATVVGDGSITQAVSLLRHVLRAASGSMPPLQTVWGRGYRFATDVSVRPGDEEPAAAGDHRAVGEPPLVGRDDLMGRLRRVLHEAAAGSARVVLLSGEPGIGKTRTCRELVTLAEALGARVFAAHVPEHPPPFWPWMELRRRAVACRAMERSAGRWHAALDEAAASLAASDGRGGGVSPTAPRARDRIRHFEHVASFWAEQAMAGPLLLVIDDAHRADVATLELADFVADRLAHAPLVLLATLRSAEIQRDRARARAIGALARRPDATSEHLERLPKQGVADLVAQATGRLCDDPEATALLDRSGGNPFLLQELVRASVRHEQARGLAALPPPVRPAIEHHLEPLSQPCRDLLLAASVLGRIVDAPLVATLCDAAVSDALVLLEEAVRADLVTALPGGRFRYVHGLLRDALYEALPASRRIALHGRAAEAIEELYGTGEEQLASLALHCAAAATGGSAAQALRYGEGAARVAERACAFDAAMAHYQQALQAARLVRAGEDVTLRLQLGLAEAAANAGDLATVRRASQQGLRRARRLADASAFARAALAFSVGSDPDLADARVVRVLEEALERHGCEGPLGPRLLARLVDATRSAAPPETVRALAARAVEAGRRSGDPDALALALTRAYGASEGTMSACEDRAAFARELVEVLPRVRGPAIRLAAPRPLLRDAIERGDRLAFDGRADALLREAERSLHPFAPWFASSVRAARLHLDGRLADAEQEARRGAELPAPGGAAGRAHLVALQIAGIRLAQGRFAEHVDELRLHGRENETPVWRAHLALGDALRGRHDRAAPVLTSLLANDLAAIRRDAEWLPTLVALAELAIALQTRDAASILLPHLRPFEAQHVAFGATSFHHGSVARRLGALAALCGQEEEALRLAREGVERDLRMGAPVFVTLGRYECARLLGRAGGRRGRSEMRALCEGLRVEASRLGLLRLCGEVETLLRG